MRALWILLSLVEISLGRNLFENFMSHRQLLSSNDNCIQGSNQILSNYLSLVSLRNPLDQQQPNEHVLCGGVLLSQNQILTSIGCVYSIENTNRTKLIIDNPNNRTIDQEFSVAVSPYCTHGDDAQILQVQKFYYILDDYTGYDKHGNVACILQLKSNVTFLSATQIPSLRTKPIQINSVITMVGHGAVSNQQDYNNISTSLKIIEFIRITDEACVQLLTDMQSDKVLNATQESCAIVKQNDSVGICEGDEGNPLYSSKGEVAGILTWWPQNHCQASLLQNQPIIFTDVTKRPVYNFLQQFLEMQSTYVKKETACNDGEVFYKAPWIVAIQQQSPSNSSQFEHICTAVLIGGGTKVITTAQCIWDTTQNWDVRDVNEQFEGYFKIKFFASLTPKCRHLNGIYPRKKLRKYFIHPSYNGDPRQGYNLAIIALDEGFPAENCFPNFEHSLKVYENETVKSMAYREVKFYKWGPEPGPYEENNQTFLINYAGQEVSMSIKPESFCLERSNDLMDTQTTFCANQPPSSEVVKICESDQGGPLIGKSTKSIFPMLIGVKQGLESGKCNQHPSEISSFTNILKMSNFILSIIDKDNTYQLNQNNILSSQTKINNGNDESNDNNRINIIIIINSAIGVLVLIILVIGLIAWKKFQKIKLLKLNVNCDNTKDFSKKLSKSTTQSNVSEQVSLLNKNTENVYQMLQNFAWKNKNRKSGKSRRHSDLPGSLEFLISKEKAQFQILSTQNHSMDDSFMSLTEGLLPFSSFRVASMKYNQNTTQNKRSFYEKISVEEQQQKMQNFLQMTMELSRSGGLILMDTPTREDFDLKIDFEKELQVGERLGSGVFGSVYKAFWISKNIQVAVKMMHSHLLDHLIDDQEQGGSFFNSFLAELSLLSRIDSPHIVKCYGGCIKPPNVCLVLEYVPNGSLDKFIHEYHGEIPIPFIMRIAQGIAEGLDALHPTIVHRDLKPQNVLLDYNYSVKLADFGVSKMKESTYLSGPAIKGTAAYASPEIYLGKSVDEKCDIYALGLIMWEMISKQRPWEELNLPVVVMARVAIKEERPTIPQNCPNELKRLIQRCWAQNPRERPSAREVVQKLTILRKPTVNKGTSSQDLIQQELQIIQQNTIDQESELGLDLTYSKFTIQSSASSIIF